MNLASIRRYKTIFLMLMFFCVGGCCHTMLIPFIH